jgi:hypothetical protein
MKQPLFRASSDTQAIVRLLATASVGQLVTWEQLSTELGQRADPGGPGYPATLSARRVLERDYQIAFEAEPTFGLRRLENVQIVQSGDRFISRARRAVKRGILRLTCVDFATLPRERQIEHNAKLSAMSAIAELGSQKAIARIEKTIGDSNSALPAAKAAIAGLSGIK